MSLYQKSLLLSSREFFLDFRINLIGSILKYTFIEGLIFTICKRSFAYFD